MTDAEILQWQLNDIECYIALPPDLKTFQNAVTVTAEAYAALIRLVLKEHSDV